MSTPQRPQPASLTPWGCDLDVICIHRGLGGLPVQQGGFISQVQCPQLGGAIRNWEKGGVCVCVCVCVRCSELFPSAFPTRQLPKLRCTSRLPLESPTPPSPSPSPFTLSSYWCPIFSPYFLPGVPVLLTCGQEAHERLTLLKATDGDHSHLVLSAWDQPLEFLGPAIHLHTLWLPWKHTVGWQGGGRGGKEEQRGGQGAGGKEQRHRPKGITSICQLVGNFEAIHPGRWGCPADPG